MSDRQANQLAYDGCLHGPVVPLPCTQQLTRQLAADVSILGVHAWEDMDKHINMHTRSCHDTYIWSQHHEQYRSGLDGMIQEHLGAMGSISKQAQSIVDGAASLAIPLLQDVMAKYRCLYPH